VLQCEHTHVCVRVCVCVCVCVRACMNLKKISQPARPFEGGWELKNVVETADHLVCQKGGMLAY
jgi:hypothetical protein